MKLISCRNWLCGYVFAILTAFPDAVVVLQLKSELAEKDKQIKQMQSALDDKECEMESLKGELLSKQNSASDKIITANTSAVGSATLISGTHSELRKVQNSAAAATVELRILSQEAKVATEQLDEARKALVARQSSYLESAEYQPQADQSRVIDVLIKRIGKLERKNKEYEKRNRELEMFYKQLRDVSLSMKEGRSPTQANAA